MGRVFMGREPWRASTSENGRELVVPAGDRDVVFALDERHTVAIHLFHIWVHDQSEKELVLSPEFLREHGIPALDPIPAFELSMLERVDDLARKYQSVCVRLGKLFAHVVDWGDSVGVYISARDALTYDVPGDYLASMSQSYDDQETEQLFEA